MGVCRSSLTSSSGQVLHDGPTARVLAEDTAIGAGDRVLVVGANGGLGLLSVLADGALWHGHAAVAA